MIDKNKMEKHFSQAASTYERFARIQKTMAENIIKEISFDDKKPLSILEIGCGTGYLTKLLSKRFPESRITACDISNEMISVSKNKKIENAKYICADIETHILTEKFDLIVSNAAFQWFNFPNETLCKLINSMEKNSIFCFSTFSDGTFQELHFSHHAAASKLGIKNNFPPGQKFLTHAEVETILFNCTNVNFEIKIEDHKLFYPSVMEFFSSIKKIGAANANENQNLNKDLLKETISTYENFFKSNDGIAATYNCLYATIRKTND